MRGPYNGKYRPLTDHLERLAHPELRMTFREIEQTLGFELPASARTHPAWWANQERGQGLAWLRAGFRTSSIDLDEETLIFLREDVLETESNSPFEPLSIAEAKERLAQTLGIEPAQIEITIKA